PLRPTLFPYTPLFRSRSHAEIFARRAERFQSECGWCGKEIGEDEPVVAIGGRTYPGLDLSLVQGKVVELKFEAVDRIILAGVSRSEEHTLNSSHLVIS